MGLDFYLFARKSERDCIGLIFERATRESDLLIHYFKREISPEDDRTGRDGYPDFILRREVWDGFIRELASVEEEMTYLRDCLTETRFDKNSFVTAVFNWKPKLAREVDLEKARKFDDWYCKIFRTGSMFASGEKGGKPDYSLEKLEFAAFNAALLLYWETELNEKARRYMDDGYEMEIGLAF